GRFLPLVLKDKVAALIYADAGTDEAGQLDGGALELLVLSTSAWLEVSTLRKQTAHREPAAERSDSRPVATAEAAPAFNDPFAAHAPTHAMAAAASAEVAAPVMTVAPEAEPAAAEEVVAAVQIGR